jgi:chromosome segregation ATPase
MPPKGSGMKRPAASEAGGSTKKRGDQNAAKCAEVVAELGNADGLSTSCRRMLAAMCKESLTVFAADRHPYQVRAVEMASETLAGIKTKLIQDLAAAQEKVDGAAVEKTSRAEAVSSAKAKLPEFDQGVKTAQEVVDTDTKAYEEAKASLASAAAALGAKLSELSEMTDKQSKLESVIKDMYDPLKASKASGKDGEKALKNLMQALRPFKFEESLLVSMSETFKKDCEGRGTFDNVIIEEVETQLSNRKAEIQAALAEHEPSKREVSDKKSSAEAACNDAIAKLAASKASLGAAETSKSEAKKSLAEAEKAVASYFEDMKATASMLDDAKSAHDDFINGPLRAFEELKDLAPPAETTDEAKEEGGIELEPEGAPGAVPEPAEEPIAEQ